VGLAVLFSILFMRAAQDREMAFVRDKAHLVAGMLNSGVFESYDALADGATRVTIIDPHGQALFDSYAGADLTANRSDRAEFILAAATGSGEATRRSATFGADTFYYAIRLESGNVLRLSRTLNSLRVVFPAMLPDLMVITTVILALAYFLTHRLTKRIIKPLVEVDFENTEIFANTNGEALYEELWPYINKIYHQKLDIDSQLAHRREFSANVSHELKTPLTTISALSEMMANGMVKASDIPDFAGKISNRSKRLIDIIDDIIRLSQFDERKIEKDFSAFDIYELAKTVISALQEKAAERAVTVELTGQPLTITANSRLLDELMYNLVENGIKYNKDGGSVTVNICEEGEWCKITVTDTGIGVAKEHQGRVFERFYRADNSRSKKTGGTGLGLSIVKHIAEHHGGKVELDSVEGVGTTIVCVVAARPSYLSP